MSSQSNSTARRPVIAAVLGIFVLGSGLGFMGCGRPPQMGADEDVFHTVDALFTAVTARDERLLGQCERRLSIYKEARQLPVQASDYLDAIVKKARAGSWQSAAERLYDFMMAQRREGPRESSKKKESHPHLARK